MATRHTLSLSLSLSFVPAQARFGEPRVSGASAQKKTHNKRVFSLQLDRWIVGHLAFRSSCTMPDACQIRCKQRRLESVISTSPSFSMSHSLLIMSPCTRNFSPIRSPEQSDGSKTTAHRSETDTRKRFSNYNHQRTDFCTQIQIPTAETHTDNVDSMDGGFAHASCGFVHWTFAQSRILKYTSRIRAPESSRTDETRNPRSAP